MLALINISVFDNLLLEAFCVGVIETLEICKYVKARNLRNVQVFLKVDNTLSCINGLSCQTLKCLKSNIVDNERKKGFNFIENFHFCKSMSFSPSENPSSAPIAFTSIGPDTRLAKIKAGIKSVQVGSLKTSLP